MCDSRQLEKQIGKVQERYSSRWSGCLRAFASRLPLARSLDMDAYSRWLQVCSGGLLALPALRAPFVTRWYHTLSLPCNVFPTRRAAHYESSPRAPVASSPGELHKLAVRTAQ